MKFDDFLSNLKIRSFEDQMSRMGSTTKDKGPGILGSL